ncbi:unnamed protein product [Rhizophagus irregularis]|nr:unnamed protein product [Rhizophagus irregularis]CAB5297771.1 unnamed protein product [Rhizophagus irregularis]
MDQCIGKVPSNIEEFEESGTGEFEGSGTKEFESSSIVEFEGSNTKESKALGPIGKSSFYRTKYLARKSI